MSSSARCLTMCAFSFSLRCIMGNGAGHESRVWICSQDALLLQTLELQQSVRSISFPLVYVVGCVERFVDFKIYKTINNAFSSQALPPGC